MRRWVRLTVQGQNKGHLIVKVTKIRAISLIFPYM